MKRTFPIFFALLILGGGVRGQARNTKAALHDRAQMFSKGADEEVDQYLRRTERETGYQVIIETVDSLKGEPIEERAQAGAKSADLHGLYILISKGDKKLWIEPGGSAGEVFTKEVIRRLARRMDLTFQAGTPDEGLFQFIGEIRNIITHSTPAHAAPAAREPVKLAEPIRASPPIVVTTSAKNPGDRVGARTAAPGIVALVLVCAGVVLAFWLLGWIIRRVMQFLERSRSVPPGAAAPGAEAAPDVPDGPRSAAGPGMPADYPGPGNTGPPPPPQGGGGGFASSALGGLGGAVLGNILYDKFGRPHPDQESSRGGTGFVPQVPTSRDEPELPSPAPPEPPAEDYDPNDGVGGDWGSEAAPSSEEDAGSGGDWGGGDEAPDVDEGPGAGGDWGDPEGGDDNQGGSW